MKVIELFINHFEMYGWVITVDINGSEMISYDFTLKYFVLINDILKCLCGVMDDHLIRHLGIHI